jgi:hypothetical protein
VGIDVSAGPVLDIGAGSGMGTVAAARALPAADLIAIEPSATMCAVLLAKLAGDSDPRRRITVRPESAPRLQLPGVGEPQHAGRDDRHRRVCVIGPDEQLAAPQSAHREPGLGLRGKIRRKLSPRSAVARSRASRGTVNLTTPALAAFPQHDFKGTKLGLPEALLTAFPADQAPALPRARPGSTRRSVSTGFRLFSWPWPAQLPGPGGQARAELMATRALIPAAAHTSTPAAGQSDHHKKPRIRYGRELRVEKGTHSFSAQNDGLVRRQDRSDRLPESAIQCAEHGRPRLVAPRESMHVSA